MGKKKGAANKLAKMSEEERARYLQHRADLEEEARRRKQQLIAIFLKVRINFCEFVHLNLIFILNNHKIVLILMFFVCFINIKSFNLEIVLCVEQIETRRSILSFEYGKNQPRMAQYSAEHQVRRIAK